MMVTVGKGLIIYKTEYTVSNRQSLGTLIGKHIFVGFRRVKWSFV